MSHFDIVADTSDFVYSPGGCMWLATHNPAQAIANADSYAYFSDAVGPTP